MGGVGKGFGVGNSFYLILRPLHKKHRTFFNFKDA